MTDSASQQALVDRYNGMFPALQISAEDFKKAYDTPDIGPYIEKDYKGLSYLSWPFAYRYLKEHFPTLFVAFEEKTLGEVVFGGPGYYYLRPYLTDGCQRTTALVFPIMDRRHNAVKELDGRAISDNCQRAAVKTIATFTGLGLRLYSGEDIPKESDQKDAPKSAPAAKTAAPSPKEASGGTSSPQASAFDGKEALMRFCSANPLQHADERAVQNAVKEALEGLGLARGTDVKSLDEFGNVITTLVSTWTKAQGIKITKSAMQKELDTMRAECAKSIDAGIASVAAFYEAKK